MSDDKLHVLQVIGTMNRGGAEVLLMELYRNIDRSRMQFDFLVFGSEKGLFDDEIIALGGKIYHISKRFNRNPISYLYVLYCFFKMHPEYQCVHSHMNDMSGYILWMANKTRIKLKIAHSHISYPKVDLFRRLVWWLGRKLIKHNADVMLGCSTEAIHYLSGLLPDSKNRIVMKNAIDIKRFAFDTKLRNTSRKEFKADCDTFIIGNVARFEAQKNQHFILHIFQKILSIQKNALLVLVGDGSLFKEIQKEAMVLNIDSQVIFLGVRDDVHEIINAFDVFLMPSLFEGLGIVLVEAQANGLPCVASNEIPSEADIHAGLIDFISLREPVETWSNAVINLKRLDLAKDPQAFAKAAGYDIQEVAIWLQSFYLNKIHGKDFPTVPEITNNCIHSN